MSTINRRMEGVNSTTPNTATPQVEWQRRLVSETLTGVATGLVAAVGQCSTNVRDIETTLREARANNKFMHDNRGVIIVQRQNHRKQRTPRIDDIVPWEGMETTHPDEAVMLHYGSLEAGTPLCMEITVPEHLNKYTGGLVMAWVGARNRDVSFITQAAIVEKHLPIGIKPDISGEPEWAITMIDALNHMRGVVGGNAPVFLVDRGGNNFDNPSKWGDAVKRNLERTGGAMMLDLAHGSEQAHDPTGGFNKSVEGQIRAMEHYIEIVEKTGMWAKGLMLEASDAPSDTDPNMPHKIALDGLAHLASLIHTPLQQATKVHFDDEFPNHTY